MLLMFYNFHPLFFIYSHAITYYSILDRCLNIVGRAFAKYDDMLTLYMPRSCCVTKVMIYSSAISTFIASLMQYSLYDDEAQMTWHNNYTLAIDVFNFVLN